VGQVALSQAQQIWQMALSLLAVVEDLGSSSSNNKSLQLLLGSWPAQLGCGSGAA
jgi:hypothetical protein